MLKASDYWQRAYLSSELRTIFEHAPPIVPVDAASTDNNRKPISRDDSCPICFMEFEGDEGTVYCKAACGNNIHKGKEAPESSNVRTCADRLSECFDQWAASRRRSGAAVSCPFCRSKWAASDGPQGRVSMDTISQRQTTGEGYINVAEELGISTQRGEFFILCQTLESAANRCQTTTPIIPSGSGGKREKAETWVTGSILNQAGAADMEDMVIERHDTGRKLRNMASYDTNSSD